MAKPDFRDSRLTGLPRLKEAIAEGLPISAVAEKLCGVDLIPAGTQMKGLCPLHDERTPSFMVNDAKGLYHCHGCKAGGDAIDLVEKVRKVDFIEAMYAMAAEADIDISKYERPMTAEEKAKEKLREACEAWIRGLPQDVSRHKEAPVSMQPRVVAAKPDFLQHLPDYLFRGVLFPLRTPQGKLCGWKTRGADKQMFATPNDFALTQRTLYGIDQARQAIRENGRVILVEGEYDCLAMHNAGFTNTIAVGGSAFSDDQMEILQALNIPKAVVLLDADEGGRTGSRKIAERWWIGDVAVYIGDLPEGKDPEDVLNSGTAGLVELLSVIGNATGALEWILRTEWNERGGSMTDKFEYMAWVYENFGAQMSGTQEAIANQSIARWLELPEAQVLDFGRTSRAKLQAADSEQIVIARCVQSKDYYRMIRKKLQQRDFFMVRHQRLWQVMEDMLSDDLDFDVITLRERAERATVDKEYLELLLETQPKNLAYHEDQVKDMSVRRFAREAGDRFRDDISDLNQDAMMVIGSLTDAITDRSLNTSQRRLIPELTDEAMETLHERMRNPNSIHGFDVGSQFPRLMQRIQGFQKKRFSLIAATSGVGKTTIAFQWAISYAVHGLIPVDFISLEMEEQEMLFKAASHLTGIDAEKITGGSIDEAEAGRVEQAMARIRQAPLRLYAPSDITPSEFVLYARESKLEHHTEIFMLDYAQLVSPDRGQEKMPRHEQLKEFGRVAKMQIAMGMDCSVICPAQLTRASKEKERPTKEDMGDCYDLSRTADVVCILAGNDESSTIDFWIDKNRQGPNSQLIPMEFIAEQQTFHEHSAPKDPDYRIGGVY